MSPDRQVEVAPERLDGWVRRFAGSHGPPVWSVDPTTSPAGWLAGAPDGSWARLQGWLPAHGAEPAPGWSAPPGPLLVLLVRRGGYAVAVATPTGELRAHKVGTRHVQGRTAAGGWSQQRFARRRQGQAMALVEAVVGHAGRVLEQGERDAGPVAALVLGGDRALVEQVLGELAVGQRAFLAGLPRRELMDLPDPRRGVLDDALRRARAVRVQVHNAAAAT